MFKPPKITLQNLTQHCPLPGKTRPSHIDMHTTLYLPSREGYERYLAAFDANRAAMKAKYLMDDPYQQLEKVHGIERDDSEWFDPTGIIHSDKLKELEAENEQTLDRLHPRFTFKEFEAFYSEQILQGVDKPVLKLFCFLTSIGKQTYSSSGYGNTGELIKLEGKPYPYGVSWKEGGESYRASLVDDTVRFFVLTYKDNEPKHPMWTPISDFDVSALGIDVDQIPCTTVEDFAYLDPHSEEAFRNLHDIIAEVGLNLRRGSIV